MLQQALGLRRDGLVQATGLSFTTSTVVLAVALGGSLAMLLPALAGMALGHRARQRLSAAVFRRCFFVGLALKPEHYIIDSTKPAWH